MKTLLSLALFLMLGAGAFAGRGWYVTIQNQTGNNVYIYPGGYDNWNTDDFGVNQTMGPYQTKTFYTEQNGIFEQGIVGINIDYGYGIYHCEMWQVNHEWSVTKNIIWLEYGGGAEFNEVLAVGTSCDFITTALRWENQGFYGTVYATFTLQAPTTAYSMPAAGDLDGDGKADPIVVNSAGWHAWGSASGYQMSGPFNLGISGTPLVADFDGDGKADPVVVESSGNWYVWPSASGYVRNGPHVLSVP